MRVPHSLAARIGLVAGTAAIAVTGVTIAANASGPTAVTGATTAANAAASPAVAGAPTRHHTAAVTAGTGTTAATAANAAAVAAVHRIPTRLSVSVAKPVRHPYQITDIVRGQLKAGRYNLRRLPVWLERRGPKGHWFAVRRERTGRHGHVIFLVHFRKSITLRLVFLGTRNFAHSKSATVTIP
jgi:hypothetical protein